MSNNLTGNKVSLTYGRLVQVVGGLYYDGLGNLLNIGGVSAENGLSIVSDKVVLGGTLSQNTTINADEYNFTLGNADTIQFTSSVFDVETDGLISLDAGIGSIQVLADDDITISSLDGNVDITADNNLNLVFSTGSVTDSSGNGLGLVYTSDYSGTFVTNSLITKKYVDNSLSTLINGITVSGPTAGLGGSLYRDTTINGSGYDFTLGDADTILFTSSVFDLEVNGLISLDAGIGSIQVLADDDITISSIIGNVDITANSNLNLNFVTGSVTDNSGNGLGLVYTSDYSGTFVTNSLITKKYVDDSPIYNLYDVNSMTYSATLSGVKKDYFGVGWTSSSVTFNLPPLSGVINGKVITIKDETGLASINPITINANGSDKIDGLNQVIIQINYASLSIIKKSNGWWII